MAHHMALSLTETVMRAYVAANSIFHEYKSIMWPDRGMEVLSQHIAVHWEAVEYGELIFMKRARLQDCKSHFFIVILINDGWICHEVIHTRILFCIIVKGGEMSWL